MYRQDSNMFKKVDIIFFSVKCNLIAFIPLKIKFRIFVWTIVLFFLISLQYLDNLYIILLNLGLFLILIK